MKLVDSTDINADAQLVWPFVADPVFMSMWNPKIVAVQREADEPVRQGERFSVTYQMSGRESPSNVEVIACEPFQRVVYRHTITQQSKEQVVEECYEISPRGNGVRVKQVMDISHSGIPLVFRILIWFIMRFGRSVGQPYMEKLKEAVEELGER